MHNKISKNKRKKAIEEKSEDHIEVQKEQK